MKLRCFRNSVTARALRKSSVGLLLVLAIMSVLQSTRIKGASAVDHTVTQADMEKWKVQLSNWGRWGKDDQKGTLNLITPEKRKEAAALVKDGFVVSLAHDALTEKAIDNPSPYEDTMTSAGPVASTDKIGVSFHGLAHTHFDALGHHFVDGKLYNGFPQKQYVTMDGGASKGAIINAKDGVFTRAILMDIPRLKNVEYLDPGTPIYVEDLEAWEKQAGMKVRAGDALFIRTGRWTRRAKSGPWDIGKSEAGLDASVIPWLKQRDVALLGSESASTVLPFPPTTQIPERAPDGGQLWDYRPVHNFVLTVLGMNVIDDMDLDKLSEACAARKRWAFLVTMAPLPMPKGTGSPINPIAVF
ncbi:MAG: cyclase family protein [Bryobacteraceae bacterium]|jgi:kynurenine formamidase